MLHYFQHLVIAFYPVIDESLPISLLPKQQLWDARKQAWRCRIRRQSYGLTGKCIAFDEEYLAREKSLREIESVEYSAGATKYVRCMWMSTSGECSGASSNFPCPQPSHVSWSTPDAKNLPEITHQTRMKRVVKNFHVIIFDQKTHRTPWQNRGAYIRSSAQVISLILTFYLWFARDLAPRCRCSPSPSPRPASSSLRYPSTSGSAISVGLRYPSSGTAANWRACLEAHPIYATGPACTSRNPGGCREERDAVGARELNEGRPGFRYPCHRRWEAGARPHYCGECGWITTWEYFSPRIMTWKYFTLQFIVSFMHLRFVRRQMVKRGATAAVR